MTVEHAALENDVNQSVAIYKQYAGYSPGSDKILANPDKITALGNMMKSGEAQKGFKVLCSNNQKDKTFEALVIKYGHLFKPSIVEAAQWRLDTVDQL